MRAILASLIFIMTCVPAWAGNSISQYSTIDALLAGVYDGHMSLETLGGYGDLGIGTFNDLDGEMALVDGVFYQVRADGKVYKPGPDQMTPFASVVDFAPENSFTLPRVDSMEDLKKALAGKMSSKNIFYAYKITGKFDYVRTRSVPAQQKPYPPLKEVVKHQPEFEFHDQTGVVVGFYCPAYVEKINVVGFHLHFLNKDKSGGGHILDLKGSDLKVQADAVDSFYLMVPDQGAFSNQDFTTSRVRELEQVEK